MRICFEEGLSPEGKPACSAVQANWAEGPGREGLEKVYMSSRSLDGDAVVIFVRALCAVSQEELLPANPDEPARYARLIQAYTHQRSPVVLLDTAAAEEARSVVPWGCTQL